MGGSDIASILGIQPKGWGGIVETYQRKTSEPKPETDRQKRKRFARGHVVEPLVANLLEALYGIKANVRNRRHIDSRVAHFAAEIDAELPFNTVAHLFPEDAFPEEIGGTNVNVEIKTVHPFAASEWGDENSDAVPIHYVAQMQWGMMVTRRNFSLCAALFGADDLRLYPVIADADIQTAMIRAAQSFWHDCVLPRVPPSPRTLADAKALWPKDTDTIVQATPDLLALVSTLRSMRDKMNTLDKACDGVELMLYEAMREANALVSGDALIATLRSQSRESVDGKRLKKEFPDAYQACAKSSTYRVVRLTKEQE